VPILKNACKNLAAVLE